MSQRVASSPSPSPDSRSTGWFYADGTAVATGSRMSRAVVVLVCSMSLVGCIITQEPNFEAPPNTPAVIVSASPALNRVVQIETGTGEPGADGGAATSATFQLTIWDPDVNQHLERLIFVQHNPDENNTPLSDPVEIPSNGTPIRTAEFDLELSDLGALNGGDPRRCWAIEAHISEDFGASLLNPRPPDPPAGEPVDLGRAIWIVNVAADPADSVLAADCL